MVFQILRSYNKIEKKVTNHSFKVICRKIFNTISSFIKFQIIVMKNTKIRISKSKLNKYCVIFSLNTL